MEARVTTRSRILLGLWGMAVLLTGCLPGSVLPSAPSTPRLLGPDDGADVRTVFPEFTWQAADGASNYVVSIRPERSEAGAEVSRSTSATRLFSPSSLTVGETYIWRVAAENGLGRSTWSESRRLRVVADDQAVPPVPDRLFGAAANGAVVPENSVVLHWSPRRPPSSPEFYELEISYADGAVFTRRLVLPALMERGPIRLELDDGLGSASTNATVGADALGVECGGAFRWRVRTVRTADLGPGMRTIEAALATATREAASFAEAASPWSETWTFRIEASVTFSPAPSWPVGGARVDRGRLQWTVPGSAPPGLAFEVEVSEAPGSPGSRAWFRPGRPGPELRPEDRITDFPIPLRREATYHWRVHAAASAGLCPGPWSDTASFVWGGNDSGFGGLAPPSCVLDSPDAVCPTRIAPTPTPTRTPRPSPTYPVGPIPGVTVVVLTPTTPPDPTKTPLPPPSATPKPAQTDADGDGHFKEIDDCDNSDGSIHPGAKETAGDGVDSNCDGKDDT